MFRLRGITRPLVQPLAKGLRVSPACSSDDLFVHRDTKDNNPQTPFEFTCENKKRLCALVGNYPQGHERAAMMAALDLVQRQVGWIPVSAMNYVAEFFRLPKMRVYEVVTFYTMFKRRFMGKLLVQVCGTTPCMLCGAQDILQAVQAATNTRAGEVSEDGMFGVVEVECLGACVNAPVFAVNDNYYEDVTPETTEHILNCLREGKIPPFGPQSGKRFSCEPANGLTSLDTEPKGPGYGLQEALK